MRDPKEIITELKSFLNRSKPFRFYTDVMKNLNELETHFPSIEEPIIEEPTEEHIEEIKESLSNILSILETEVIEEPAVEVVIPKKRPRKTSIK